MTVRELIEALSKESPDAVVYRRDYEQPSNDDCDDITAVIRDEEGDVVIE